MFDQKYQPPDFISNPMKLSSINYKSVIARPDLLAQIIGIDDSSDTCFQDMDKLIRSDQGAVSFVLRAANSALYSRGKHIKIIPHAISLLGINIIRSLATLSISRAIFTQNKNALFQQHVWQHSLLTALACQQICLEMNEIHLSEEAFVAGLLHDIGKVLLYQNCPDDYPAILDYAQEQYCSCAEAEQKFLGINHIEIGKQAVLEWNLPKHFADYSGANLDVLMPDENDNKVVRFLAIANSLIKNMGFGARNLDIAERRIKLVNLGASDSLCEMLLEDVFLQKLMQNDIYLFSL